MLTVDPKVGKLISELLEVPQNVQIYSNGVNPMADALIDIYERRYTKLSGVCNTPADRERLEAKASSGQGRRLKLIPHEDISLFNPIDQYHMGVSMYPFTVNKQAIIEEDPLNLIKPVMIQDKLMAFECSKGKEDRIVETHLLGLESMLRGVIVGGWFASILPENWIGRNMRYLNWWHSRAGQAIRIKLPESAITWHTTRRANIECERHLGDQDMPWSNTPYKTWAELPLEKAGHDVVGKWELIIWNKLAHFEDFGDQMSPNSERHRNMLKYAEFVWNPFIFTLESMTDEAIGRCVESYRKNDWWLQNNRLWIKLLAEHSSHGLFGTYQFTAHGLNDPKDVWFFDPSEENKLRVEIVSDVDEIRNRRGLNVHIKVGSTVKLSTYNYASQSAVLDLKFGSGLKDSGDGWTFTFDEPLKRLSFADVREPLIKQATERGLTPCMTQSDFNKIERQERWLDIELTPMERQIAVKVETKDEDGNPKIETHWENMYEDIGMQAIHPELLELWRKRARSMNLHKYLFDFQFEDLVRHACKYGLLNANVMGLGKTREAVFLPLLLGCKKCLIVVPQKLLGVWQEEIQGTVAPYVRKQKKDWQGKLMRATVNVIEWAADLEQKNLCYFNIISYDRLKTTPNDGRFYKCPRCSKVVFSAEDRKTVPCPGKPVTGNMAEDFDDPCHGALRKWKFLNSERYPEEYDNGDPHPFAGKLKRQKYMRRVSTGKKIDWRKQHLYPESDLELVDERGPKPEVPMMEKQRNKYKKIVPQITGYEEKEDGTKVPKIKYVDRNKGMHAKWTFAELLRRRFNLIIADELLYIVNEKSQRTQALFKLCSKRKVGLTGTPVKGYPQKVLTLLNWLIKRQAFPNYRSYDEGSTQRFMRKYRTDVMIGGTEIDGEIVGGKPKQVPKINNPEMFQTEIAPHMRRHTRNEPDVEKDIPHKKVVQEEVEVEMDPQHKDYYKKWQREFSEWWKQMKEEEEGRTVRPGDILTKLGYLIQASSVPHDMLKNILKSKDVTVKRWARKIGVYKGPPTAKQLKARELVEQAIELGDKIIVFAWRTAALDRGHSWANKNGLYSMVVDGRVPLTLNPATQRTKRHELVDQFRNYKYHVMWGGLTALAEGMNIPEANRGVIHDYSWDPTEPRQAIARMIRPQQRKTVYSTYLMHKGAIDGYLAALCYLKGRSADEGIDYMEFDDFSVDLIPDVHQYADSIVDGTEEVLKQRMWLAIDHLKKQAEEGEEEL